LVAPPGAMTNPAIDVKVKVTVPDPVASQLELMGFPNVTGGGPVSKSTLTVKVIGPAVALVPTLETVTR
jgi:hypothetical protein